MKRTDVQPLRPEQTKGKQKPTPSLRGQDEIKASTSPGSRSTGINTEKDTRDLRGLFVQELQDIYETEQAVSRTLPEMIDKATSRELVRALQNQLNMTERQIVRCEKVLDKFKVKPGHQIPHAIVGLIQDTRNVIETIPEGTVRDAGIIAATQKLDHYKIATYGTLSAFARELGEPESMQWLRETLREEHEADQQLTQVAEQAINPLAAAV